LLISRTSGVRTSRVGDTRASVAKRVKKRAGADARGGAQIDTGKDHEGGGRDSKRRRRRTAKMARNQLGGGRERARENIGHALKYLGRNGYALLRELSHGEKESR